MMMIDQNGSVGGGKLGYNNNQYLANAHSAHSELMLGHINDDSVSTKLLSGGGLDSKSDQLDYDQDGGNTETETKSVSSIKSSGSNTDVRYLWLLFVCYVFLFHPLIFHLYCGSSAIRSVTYDMLVSLNVVAFMCCLIFNVFNYVY